MRHTLINKRAVWAAITRRPNSTIRDLMTATGISFGGVRYITLWLERAGYIERRGQPGQARTGWDVIVGLW